MFHTEDLFLFRGMITWVVKCYLVGWVSLIQRNLRFFSALHINLIYLINSLWLKLNSLRTSKELVSWSRRLWVTKTSSLSSPVWSSLSTWMASPWVTSHRLHFPRWKSWCLVLRYIILIYNTVLHFSAIKTNLIPGCRTHSPKKYELHQQSIRHDPTQQSHQQSHEREDEK